MRASGLLTANHIVNIQAELERNNAGFRKLPSTALKDGGGQTVYTPPQNPAEIIELMRGLERFIRIPEKPRHSWRGGRGRQRSCRSG